MGAAFVGAAATLFVATPAFAHHPTPVGDAVCNPAGGWTVNWTIGSSNNKQEFQLTVVQAKDGTSDANIAGSFTGELGSLPTAFKLISDTFTGSQSYSSSVTSVWLQVTGMWQNTGGGSPSGPHTNNKTQAEVVQQPDCDPDPVVTFKDNCDGTVTVTLGNENGQAPITFTVNGTDHTVNGGAKKDVTVPGNAEVVVSAPNNDDWTHTWKQPTTPCPTTPVTGASVTGPVGIGAGLLLGGIALVALVFFMRRRRSLAG
jgi:hypothetical protein